jgi:O-acetylhomoserine (thiol)-lyase
LKGIAAVVTASGTAAIATTLLVLLKAVIILWSQFIGTYNLLNVTCHDWGLPLRLSIRLTFLISQKRQEKIRRSFAESLGIQN